MMNTSKLVKAQREAATLAAINMTKTPAAREAISDAASKTLFQKLESLEQEMNPSSQTGQNRWIVPYADLMTLLLGMFLVLFASAKGTDLHPGKPLPPAAIAAMAKQQAQTPDQRAMRALETSLQTRFKMNGAHIQEQSRGVVISLKDNILFAPGSADLSPSARTTLSKLADQLSTALGENASTASPSRPIRVEGFTDNTPIRTSRFPSNWELSTARATNIVRYLIDTGRFQPEQLSAAGYGEFKPLGENSSIEGKQKNRRVDIVIMNDRLAQQEPPMKLEAKPSLKPLPLAIDE